MLILALFECRSGWAIKAAQPLPTTGLSSGEAYRVGFIPPHGGYKEQRPGFTYDARTDNYFCSQGKRLVFDRRIVDRQGNAKNRYMAQRTDCQRSPVNVACKGQESPGKVLA
jgi:hypothetical protein